MSLSEEQQGDGSSSSCNSYYQEPGDSAAYLPAYRNQRASRSFDDGSSYEGDRPLSRLTILDNSSEDLEEDELSLVDIDSPSHQQPYEEEEEEEAPYRCLQQQGGGRGHGGPPTHTCEECCKTFASPGKLRQHEYSHTGETPFECRIPGCDKKFTSKFKLKRHILIHSQTKTFTCHTCRRAFRRKDHLKNHEKVHDPGKTVYACSYAACGRSYNSLSSFKKHQAMHSAEEGQLDCKICKAVLLNQEELLSHLKIHAGSRAGKATLHKKFNCVQCDKKFFTRKDLKRHSVVHTGNREFCCPYCTQRFGRKDHMTRHAKKTHSQLFDGGGEPQQPRHRRLSSSASSSTAEPLLALLRGHQQAPSCRKERSVSDPGPYSAPMMPIATDEAFTAVVSMQQQQRPLLSPTGVLSAFQKLGTRDIEGGLAGTASAAIVFHSSSSNCSRLLPSYNGFPEEEEQILGFINEETGGHRHSDGDLLLRPLVGGDGPLSASTPPLSLLSVPVREGSITTPEAGSSGDEGEDRSMATPGIVMPPNNMFEESAGSLDDLPPTVGITDGMGMAGAVDSDCMIVKQEADRVMAAFPPASEEDTSLFAEEEEEASALRELLDEKDRMDIASFISSYNSEIYALQQHQKADSSSSMETENEEMEKMFIRQIKAEPMVDMVADAPSSTPPDSGPYVLAVSTQEADSKHQVLGTYDDDMLDQQPANPLIPTSYICTATLLTRPRAVTAGAALAATMPRPIFIRTQSQDSLTRTKNPVLPNIHSELLPLVVPEPRLARYQSQPTAEAPFSLDDFDEDQDEAVVATSSSSAVAVAARAAASSSAQQQQLTELKGSLFLAEDYGQSYFQPWN